MPVSPELASLLNASAQNDIDQEVMKFAKDKGISIDEAKQVIGAPEAVPEAEGVGDLIPKDIKQQAAQQSAKEATQTSGQLFRNVAIPAAQTALAIGTGGMSIPAQMAIGAGTEYGLQKAGLAPESGLQVGLQAAMPFAGKIIEGAKGVARLGANLVGKGQKAGEQAAADVMGVVPDVVQRARATPASRTAYQAAETGGEVSTSRPLQAIQDAIAKEEALGSQANRQTLKYLRGVEADLVGAGGAMPAEQAVAKAQRLSGKTTERFQRKAPTEGQTLKEATGTFKETIPGLKEADVIRTREDVVDKMFGALRKGKKVEAIDNLLKEEGGKITSVMSEKEIRDLRLIASRIHNMGQDVGILKAGMDAALKSFLADPNGLTVFRHAFGPTMERLSPQRLTGLMTFIRGYEAQKRRKD